MIVPRGAIDINNIGPPIISLTAPDAVSQITDACSTWGAFVAVDHGMSSDLQSSVLALGHEFFDLPLPVKQSYNLQQYGAKWRGYMPLFGERSVHGKLKDYKEGLYMGDNHDPLDPRVLQGLPTFGSNVYPEQQIPEMAATFEAYHQEMKDLGDRIMALLS